MGICLLDVAALLPCLARKCARERQRSYVPSWTTRFVRIVSDVFLDYANDLNRGHSARQARHPVLFGDTQQLVMDREAVCEAFYPAQTGGFVDSDRAFVLFTIYS